MSLFGESREAIENRFALMRKTHDLQMQEHGEIVRVLQRDVDRLKHSLELALSASRRWERMHDREHQERKCLENRVGLLEAEKAFHRLEVVPDAAPEIAPDVEVESAPLDVPWVSLSSEELAQHASTVSRDGLELSELELVIDAVKRRGMQSVFEGDPIPSDLSDHPITVRRRGRPRKVVVDE